MGYGDEGTLALFAKRTPPFKTGRTICTPPTGRESWRSARGQESVVLSTPRPRGGGKRRPERGEGAAKRPRMESSSSDRRDGSEESRSGRSLPALFHAGARGLLGVRSWTYGVSPLPQEVTEGPRTTDGQARDGGPDPESPRYHS